VLTTFDAVQWVGAQELSFPSVKLFIVFCQGDEPVGAKLYWPVRLSGCGAEQSLHFLCQTSTMYFLHGFTVSESMHTPSQVRLHSSCKEVLSNCVVMNYYSQLTDLKKKLVKMKRRLFVSQKTCLHFYCPAMATIAVLADLGVVIDTQGPDQSAISAVPLKRSRR